MTTTRDTVGQELDLDFVEELLGNGIDAQRVSLIRDRLITFVLRYDRVDAHAPTITRKDRQLQVRSLQTKAVGLASAIRNLHRETEKEIQNYLEGMTTESRWEGFDFSDLDQEIPKDDETLEGALQSCDLIVQACQISLDQIEQSKGTGKKSAKLALDQLILDLAALYETETGVSAKSQCYRSESSADEFSGQFFVMAKRFLDHMLPHSYGTPVALGRRIERVLSYD